MAHSPGLEEDTFKTLPLLRNWASYTRFGELGEITLSEFWGAIFILHRKRMRARHQS